MPDTAPASASTAAAALPPAAPIVLSAEISALRTDLLDARYVTEHVEELLGEVAAAALRREDPVPARRRLAARAGPAAARRGLVTRGAGRAAPSPSRSTWSCGPGR